MSQENADIKSTAIVKFTAVEMPARFHQLQINTDLKQPPANWLQGNSKLENNLRNLSLGKGHFFSSFKLAHYYPDLTGEIDVVSDAENIKKLLKMPYSQCHVSMMVHRVGNTLLLDDFDIHRHLLREQQKDWQWLRKFYYETVVESMKERLKNKMHVIKKNKSRDHLQNMNMFSKFLYYSIGRAEDYTTDQTEHSCSAEHQGAALSSSNDMLPDPFPQTEKLQPEQQRTFQWTFEDIRMLIGTDLPIFGGRTHPCISLRLRDQCTPINVLTGLDYWLDNLMCNVPEMAMCYHLDGIVKNYEIIKTEEIPKLCDSEFSPTVIKDIAQNILSFLKSNATKEGHTYWLFKGHGDDIVKLYDLTTLCADMMNGENVNPFTVPVGILLYRVARNMQQNNGRRKSGTIQTLLKKCLLLLDGSNHPQIVTSAHLLLSDLYVPDNLYSLDNISDTSEDSDVDDESTQDSCPDLEEDTASPCKSIDVQSLCVADTVSKPDRIKDELIRYPPVSGSIPDRCGQALENIAEGLSCLDASLANGHQTVENKGTTTKEPIDDQPECDPNKAIPLHYQPIRMSQQPASANHNSECIESDSPDSSLSHVTGQCESPDPGSANQVTVFNRSLLSQGSWHRQSKSLLVRKAAIAYYGLAESMLSAEKHVMAWKYVRLALYCFRVLQTINADMSEKSKRLLCVILSLCGDVHLMLARDSELVQRQYSHLDEDSEHTLHLDQKIARSLSVESQDKDESWLLPFSFQTQDNLERACRSYSNVMDLCNCIQDEDDPESLVALTTWTKRYGNILNELAVFYMKMSSNILTEPTGDTHQMISKARQLWSSSEACFYRGIKQFEAISDQLNMALLYSNLAKLYRLCAQGVRQIHGQLYVETPTQMDQRIDNVQTDAVTQPSDLEGSCEVKGSQQNKASLSTDDHQRNSVTDAMQTDINGQKQNQNLEFTPEEAQYFTKAQDCYKEALSLLADQSAMAEYRQSISWELCNTYYTMATLLQDYAPLSTKAQEQVETEVVKLMKKALEFCCFDKCSSQNHSYLYRAGTIHHRLGSLYHNTYRNQVDDRRLRVLRKEAETNYEKARELFTQTQSSCELVRVQLERVALLEYQLQNQNSIHIKMKTLHSAFEALLLCQGAAASLAHQVSTPDCEAGFVREAEKLLTIFISRLQHIGLNMVKYSSGRGKKTLSSSGHCVIYKKIYSIILSGTSENAKDLSGRYHTLEQTLSALNDIWTKEQPTDNKTQSRPTEKS